MLTSRLTPQDGFVLVGSVAGQRYWSTILSQESTITSGSWTPDDQQVRNSLFNGIFASARVTIDRLVMCWLKPPARVSSKAIDWHTPGGWYPSQVDWKHKTNWFVVISKLQDPQLRFLASIYWFSTNSCRMRVNFVLLGLSCWLQSSVFWLDPVIVLIALWFDWRADLGRDASSSSHWMDVLQWMGYLSFQNCVPFHFHKAIK